MQESQQRMAEYRDIASSLHLWIREKLSIMMDRTFPNTLIEMKKLAAESSHFRTDEVPPRQKDKQKLIHMFRELEVSIKIGITFIFRFHCCPIQLAVFIL